jgi:hypothetical protein
VVIAAGGPALASAAALADSGPGIGRRAAQQLARRELSRAIYQPSLTDRILSWLGQQLTRLFTDLNKSIPGGWWALIALIVACVLTVAVVLLQLRPATAGRRSGGPLLAGAGLSAGDHRELAERLAAAGDYAGAIIERMRAIAVELEQRGVLPPGPGRTAAELAVEAGRALPAQAEGLGAAARRFDDVRYGGRNGTAAGYQQLRELDIGLQAARPASTAALLPAGAAARTAS